MTTDYEKIAEGCLLLEQSKKDSETADAVYRQWPSVAKIPRNWRSMTQHQKDRYEQDRQRQNEREEQQVDNAFQKAHESQKAVEDFAVENMPGFKEKVENAEAERLAELEEAGSLLKKETKEAIAKNYKAVVRLDAVRDLDRICKTPTM